MVFCYNGRRFHVLHEKAVPQDNLKRPGWNWQRDHFKDNNPAIHWKETLAHGEKIGLGSRDYELIVMK